MHAAFLLDLNVLLQQDFKVPCSGSRVAFLIEKGANKERICEVIREATDLRASGKQVLISQMNKNKKFQKEQLVKEGYDMENIKDFYNTALK